MGDQLSGEDYAKDPRRACKYGAKCYQKNPIHLEKYKHPPAKRSKNYPKNEDLEPPTKKAKNEPSTARKDDKTTIKPLENTAKNSEDPKPAETSTQHKNESSTASKDDTIKPLENAEDPKPAETSTQHTPKSFEVKEFIKQKFLVEMPEDFYQFWNYCKTLKPTKPEDAFKDANLTLVGPFDVLAGKFYDIPEQSDDNYLVHWRYYHDPPECQTVLKGDSKTGFHIGYFRDSPKDEPVFLVSNCSQEDGVFKVVGNNIFAAVYLYLEDLKKSGDPFKKMHISKLQNSIKSKAEELQYSLTEKTTKIKERNKKIVARSFNRIGLVVPYNRKTQLGYRDIGVSNQELTKLLTEIQRALPEQKPKFLSKLQDILTNVSIATDECDFGAGIELGWDILAHGVDCLNQTVSRYLGMNYRLIGREEFAKIAEAHMKNRRKGSDLSVI